jgi:hypothetical protein
VGRLPGEEHVIGVTATMQISIKYVIACGGTAGCYKQNGCCTPIYVTQKRLKSLEFVATSFFVGKNWQTQFCGQAHYHATRKNLEVGT